MTECIFCTEKILKAGEVPAALCCGHVFHERCIKTWFRSKKQCPTCKQTQELATSKLKDGIIRLYLDAASQSPGKCVSDGTTRGSIDLTGNKESDAASSAAAGEVFLLRHSLLHTEQELIESKRQLDSSKRTIINLENELRLEADKCRSLGMQARKAEADVRQRDYEIRDLKARMLAEQNELLQARSLQATHDALQLDKEGDYEQAVDRLAQACKGPELLNNFKAMLKFRQDRITKLDENTIIMKRDIQALKLSEIQSKKRADKLEADNSILRKKLERSKTSVFDLQSDAASARAPQKGGQCAESSAGETWRAPGSPPEWRNAHDAHGAPSAHPIPRGETPKTVCREDSCSSHASESWAAGARARIRGRSMGSLIGAARGSSLMSNDADDGGRFIRSGPDGMGGTVHVCVQAQQHTSSMRGSLLQQPLKPLGVRSISCNPMGVPSAGSKRPQPPNNGQSSKKAHEAPKKQRSTTDISSFFVCRNTAGAP